MIPVGSHPFRGIYAATLLPFTAEGAIDRPLLARHFADCAGVPGIVGVLCNGHAGENFRLSRVEKRVVVATAAETIGATSLIVSGIVAETVNEAVEQAQDARDAGADALLVFPAFSWAGTQDADVIVALHAAIAAATDMPIMLYLAPVAGGLAYAPDLLARLLQVKGVVGIKEGSWETNAYDRNRRLVARLAPQVEVMASGDEHLLPCFAIGSTGSLVSLAAIIPRAIVALKAAVDRGDLVQARTLHDDIQPLANLIYGNVPASRATARLKACMVALGHWPSAVTRVAAEALSPAETQVLIQALGPAARLDS